MDDVIIFAAKYLIYVMVVGFALAWLLAEKRRGKVELGVAAVIGLVLVLIFIEIASSSYTDPRPFVVDPSVAPLIPHAPDNGFPSDHSAAVGLMAALVLLRRRWISGVLLAIGAALVAWGRVASHVHHLLDVSVGLAAGVLAAVLGLAAMTLLARRTPLLTAGPLGRWVSAGAGSDDAGSDGAGPGGAASDGAGSGSVAGPGSGTDSAGRASRHRAEP